MGARRPYDLMSQVVTNGSGAHAFQQRFRVAAAWPGILWAAAAQPHGNCWEAPGQPPLPCGAMTEAGSLSAAQTPPGTSGLLSLRHRSYQIIKRADRGGSEGLH